MTTTNSPEESSSPSLTSEQEQSLLKFAQVNLTLLANVAQQIVKALCEVGIDPTELLAHLDPRRNGESDPTVAAGEPADAFSPAGSEELHHS